MFHILTIIFTITMFYPAFSLSGFARSEVLPETSDGTNVGISSPKLAPYKVTGIACLDGEHCELIKKGKYAGYYLKSNIPLGRPPH